LITKLTEINGVAIADLERVMRPGELSQAGFLGDDESLLRVMAADNRHVVDELGLTHQELAKHLRAMQAIFHHHCKTTNEFRTAVFVYNGRRFTAWEDSWFDSQGSPFRDGTWTSVDVTVTNLDNGKELKYSGLVPLMIERYGFYEGKGTPYRVEPRDVIEVFDFLKSGTAATDEPENHIAIVITACVALALFAFLIFRWWRIRTHCARLPGTELDDTHVPGGHA
jgi:hypothetical protein